MTRVNIQMFPTGLNMEYAIGIDLKIDLANSVNAKAMVKEPPKIIKSFCFKCALKEKNQSKTTRIDETIIKDKKRN